MTGQKQVAECESTTTPSLHYHLPSYLFVVDIIISGPPGSSTNPDKAMMDRNLDVHMEVFGNPQGLSLLDLFYHHLQAQDSRMTQLECAVRKLEPCMALFEIVHVPGLAYPLWSRRHS